MISLPHCLLSKNAPLRSTPLTTKSPCRSPNRRFNNSSSNFTKIRRLWNNPNHCHIKSNNQRNNIPILNFSNLGHYHNQFYLSTTDRFKIINCLFISKPYRSCSSSHPHPNTMKLCRSHNLNNCTRPNFISLILSIQYQL